MCVIKINKLILLFIFNLLLSSFCFAQTGFQLNSRQVQTQLITEVPSIAPGQPFWVGLHMKIVPGWHTYWKNPGDSGQPTRIKWTLPEGFSAGPLEWPYPRRYPVGTFVNFGYENEVLLLTKITPPSQLEAGQEAKISARANWLVCRDICIPEDATMSVSIPIGKAPVAPQSPWKELFSVAKAELPGTLTHWDVSAEWVETVTIIKLKPKSSQPIKLDNVVFFPDQEGAIENAEPQVLTTDNNVYQLMIKNAPQSPPSKVLQGVLVSAQGWGGKQPKAVQVNIPVKVKK